MKLRGEITYRTLPISEQISLGAEATANLPHNPKWLCHDEVNFSPPNASELEVIRAHCIEYPQGVLLDVYQDLTALGLKHESGTVEAQRRYLNGLRSETTELHRELLLAQFEHPYRYIADATEEFEDFWLMAALDTNKLRFPHLSAERKQHYVSELGDVLWYLARVSSEMKVNLSQTVFEFLLSIDAGNLQTYVAHGEADKFRDRFAQTMDFDLFQTVALDVSDRVLTTNNQNTYIAAQANIDNMPVQLFGSMCEDGLWPGKGVAEEWDPAQPFSHLEDLNLTLGKLTWFVAYTAHSLLNADFRTVMQTNLKKMVLRTRNGTLFDKDERDRQEEAATLAEGSRMPLTNLE